jgi:hypothetical protein
MKLRELAEMEHQVMLIKRKKAYLLETEGNKTFVDYYSEFEIENLATFCRSFLSAWKNTQKLENLND